MNGMLDGFLEGLIVLAILILFVGVGAGVVIGVFL